MTKELTRKYYEAYQRIMASSPTRDLRSYEERPGIISSLVALAGQHYARAKTDDVTSDLDNRINCIDTDWKFDSYFNRSVDRFRKQYKDNPVYQKILASYRSSDKEFAKIRKTNRIKYAKNDVRNSKGKMHEQYFKAELSRAWQKFELRRMGQAEYELIEANSDSWLKDLYELSHSTLKFTEATTALLEEKKKSCGALSPTEKFILRVIPTFPYRKFK